jgi:hypothetical protein
MKHTKDARNVKYGQNPSQEIAPQEILPLGKG